MPRLTATEQHTFKKPWTTLKSSLGKQTLQIVTKLQLKVTDIPLNGTVWSDNETLQVVTEFQ